MAKNKEKDNNSTFSKLKQLFSTGTITNQINNKNINISDLDTDSTADTKTNLQGTNLMGRFNKIYQNGVGGGFPNQQQQTAGGTYKTKAGRKMRYRDYETMDKDSLNSSVLDIYAEESTLKNDDGNVITINTEDDDIKEELENLFFNTLNLNMNGFPWVRNLVKYGDFFLILEIDEEDGIIDAHPFSVYELDRTEEVEDGKKKIVYQLKNENNTLTKPFENYEVIHFRLLADTNFLPYGRSILENGRRIWKQLKLMEDAMMVYRIMRAPERRIFYVNVGNLPSDEIDQWMEKFSNRIKKQPIVDPKTGQLDLKYNVQNTLEDFFFPVRGNDKSTKVDTLSGGKNTDKIDDIEYLKCLRGDTEIKLLSGENKEIKEIVNDFEEDKYWTWSVNPKTKKLEPVKIIGAQKTRKNAKLLRVHLNNGKYIDATPDHRFMLRDGTYKQAQNLEPNDKLMPVETKETNLNDNKSKGYEKIYNPGKNRMEYSHRIIAEDKYNDLNDNTIIHHCNGNKKNNHPDNLLWIDDISNHTKLHGIINKSMNREKENNPAWKGTATWEEVLDIANNCNSMTEFREKCMNSKYNSFNAFRRKIKEKGYKNWEFSKEILGNKHADKFKGRYDKNKVYRTLMNYYKNKNKYHRNDLDKIINNNDFMSYYHSKKLFNDLNIKFGEGVKRMVVFYFQEYKNLLNSKKIEKIVNNSIGWKNACKKLGVNTKNTIKNYYYKYLNGNNKLKPNKPESWLKGTKGKITGPNKGKNKYEIHKCYNCNELFITYHDSKFCSHECNTELYKNHGNDDRNFIKEIEPIIIGNYNKITGNDLSVKEIKNNKNELEKDLNENYKNHKVKKVEKLDITEDTYDIQVSKNNNFALSNGIFVHNSKLLSSYKTPKEFLQYGEKGSSQAKANLALKDIRFGRSVERVQRTIEAELKKMAIIHLYTKGFEGEDLTNYELSLTRSSTLQEQQKIDIMKDKVNVISNAVRENIFSMEYFYKNLFDLSDDEIQEIRKQLLKEKKFAYAFDQLERQGENPLTNNDQDDDNDENNEENENPFEINIGDMSPDKPSTQHDSKRILGYSPNLQASNRLDKEEKEEINETLGINIDKAILKDKENNENN